MYEVIMSKKNVDEMSFNEIKEEIAESRKREEQIVADLTGLVDAAKIITNSVNTIKLKYGFLETTERAIIEAIIDKKSQKQAVIDIVKEKGMISAEELIDKLIEQKVVENNDRSKNNIRTVFSRLAFNEVIEKVKNENGTFWKFLKEEKAT